MVRFSSLIATPRFQLLSGHRSTFYASSNTNGWRATPSCRKESDALPIETREGCGLSAIPQATESGEYFYAPLCANRVPPRQTCSRRSVPDRAGSRSRAHSPSAHWADRHQQSYPQECESASMASILPLQLKLIRPACNRLRPLIAKLSGLGSKPQI